MYKTLPGFTHHMFAVASTSMEAFRLAMREKRIALRLLSIAYPVAHEITDKGAMDQLTV